MQYEGLALRRRLNALGVAAALLGSSLVGAPAAFATDAATGVTSTETTAASMGSAGTTAAGTASAGTTSAIRSPAGLTAADAAELEAALARDLELTPEEFEAQGALAQKAAQAMPVLETLDGFVSIATAPGTPARLVITGTGADLQKAADELGAQLIAPEPTGAGAAAAETAPAETAAVETATAGAESDAGSEPAAYLSANMEHSDPVSGEVGAAAETASSVQEILADYLEVYGPEGLQHLQAIMQDSSGEYVVRMAEPAESLALARPSDELPTVEEFEARYTNLEAEEADGPAEPLSTLNDETLVGGLGLFLGNSIVCSLGFNAYSPEGNAALISAGHCPEDGRYTDVSLIDPQTRHYPADANDVSKLGQITFSQFGGINNATASQEAVDWWNDENFPLPADTGTDVAIVENLEAGFVQLPAVTDWKDLTDPVSTGPLVTGTTEPIHGAAVCASGHTTDWNCAAIDYIGIFLVRGTNNYLDPTDIRIVQGYGSEGLVTEGGDSGGANISGTLAVGVTSAGGTDDDGVEWTYGASIGPMLQATGGYTLQLFVETPVLAPSLAGDVLVPGATIHGTAPAGSEVTVTSDGEPLTVNVNTAGDWSFDAPEEAGVLEFVVRAAKGFSVSAPQSYTVIIEEPAPVKPAPVKSEYAPAVAAGPQPMTAVIATDGNISRLPETGASALLPLTGSAALLLLGGATVIGLSRRRLGD